MTLFIDVESKAQGHEINWQVTPIASHHNTLVQWFPNSGIKWERGLPGCTPQSLIGGLQFLISLSR